MMLAIELAHRSGLAEAEQRLGRDLVDDTLAGGDVERVALRAGRVGGRRSVSTAPRRGRPRARRRDRGRDRRAVAAAARALDAGPLVGRRDGLGVLLAHRPLLWP